jgi:hypothetical protein
VETIVSAHLHANDATVPRTFWFKPVSNFGLFIVTMFIRQFTYIVHTQLALAPYRLVAGSFNLSSRIGLRIPVGTFPGSFTQVDYSSCMCRWALSAE